MNYLAIDNEQMKGDDIMVSPSEGGCWYCHKKDDNLVFSCEFDTFLHLECLEERLKEDPDDREAQIIKRELE